MSNYDLALQALANGDFEVASILAKRAATEAGLKPKPKKRTQMVSARMPSALLSQIKVVAATNGQPVSRVLEYGARAIVALAERNAPHRDIDKVLKQIAKLLGLDPALVTVESITEALRDMTAAVGDPLADTADEILPEQLAKARALGMTADDLRHAKARAVRRHR